MRIKLTMRPGQATTRVPINYQYPLSAAIYKILRLASEPYSAFLHDKGYRTPGGRFMKLFTFSKLRNSHINIRKTPGLTSLESREGHWTLLVGSPMVEEFVQHFVLGLFQSSEIVIAGGGVSATFQVAQVETLPAPPRSHQLRTTTLSPVSVSKSVVRNGRELPHYLLPDDPGLSTALKNNAVQKHLLVHSDKPEDDSFNLTFEKEDRPRTKLITIKENRPDETKRRGFEGRFILSGSPELIQTVWQCGLGEAGAMGFGMIDVLKP